MSKMVNLLGITQLSIAIITLATFIVITSADSFDGGESERSSAAARFIARKAARAAAAAARSSPDIDPEHSFSARAAAARHIAARAARAAAADSAAAARPAAFYPSNNDEDLDLYWAALNTPIEYNNPVAYKWNRHDRSSNSGQPKRTGSNRKFQTQGW